VSISDDPDQIRRDIERTQAHLSSDVDALTDKVTPSRIVERRVGRARAAAGRLRERVMGEDDPAPSYYRTGAGPAYDAQYGQVQSADRGVPGAASSAASSVSDAASTAASTVSDAASSAATAVQEAPQAARRQTQGNPLAAGLIAFGAGWLISSLLPASRQEQQLAEQAREKATELGQPLAEKAKQAAAEVRDNLQEPAQQAVESVRSTATDAGQTVADEGRTAAREVQDTTRDAAGTVRQNASDSSSQPANRPTD
jgi:vacuolar-type H+-ATPase subunit H